MCMYIGIESLVANTLIALLNDDKDSRFVSYKELENYGAKIVKYFTDKKKKVILIFSRETTSQLYDNYSDFFIEKKLGNELGIELYEHKTVEDLINKFLGSMSLELLKACIDNPYKGTNARI